MAAPVNVRNLVDSYTSSATPTKNYGTVALMYVGTGNLSYLFWGNPIPHLAKVISAKLHVYSAATWSGSVTLTAQAINAAWSANKVTWNNDPGTIGATASQTKSGAARGTHWIIDITTIMQAASNGQRWYGVRLSATGSAAKALYSMQASASYRPWVEITWSDAPLPPTNLMPRGGPISTPKPILSFNFLDVAGNRTMDGLQVQISTVANFASTVYDSGPQDATVPMWNLTPTAFSATAGTTYYWRVKTQDGAGLWSDWSIAQSFKYLVPPTLTLLSPSNASPYVEEASPPISWNFTGTQVSYRVMLTDPLAPSKMLYDSGVVSSANQYHTLPAGVLKTNGKTYTIAVRVRDNMSRVATPGFPSYFYEEIDFDYRYSATVTPCTSVTATLDSLGLSVRVDARRATVPDYFTLVRDGVVLKTNIMAVSVQDDIDPQLFHFTDYPPGRMTVGYTVVPVVNGKSAAGNPVGNFNAKRVFSWLCAPDGTLPVALANPAHEMSDGEMSAVVSSVNGPPMLITQALYGESGTLSGVLSDKTVSGLSARAMRNNLRLIRSRWNGNAKFLFSDEAMEVYIHNISIQRVPYADGTTDYDVQAEFFQVD